MTARSATIITGAASGIGAALTKRLAGPGARLTLHTRHSKDRLEAVASEARRAGAKVEVIYGDLASAGTATEIITAHQSRFGVLDQLVANAGFPLLKSLDDMTPDDIRYAFAGNSESFFALAQAALPMLRQSKSARIVALGSFTAHVFRTDMPQFPASAASKGAVETAVKSLALALARDGITVNCVVPGYIEKDAGTADGLDEKTLIEILSRIPAGRLGKPDDVAGTIAFLLGQDADYISGQIIHVSGGL